MSEDAAAAPAVEGTAEELPDEEDPVTAGVGLATTQATGQLTVAPEVEAAELGKRLAVIRQTMENEMTRDVDYGVIPGTDKPALFKPGSEKLGVLFQLDIQLANLKTWGPGDHLTVESQATVYHAPTGARLGFGEGMCSTREAKYGKRKQQRLCPQCGKAAVIKGKEDFGGGWLCFKKKDGCGAKWPDGEAAIESQQVGEVENPDLPDTWNTVVKMAAKRARVDAVLAVTGASALFTQDTEDGGPAPEPTAPFGAPAEEATVAKVAEQALPMLLDTALDNGRPSADEVGQLMAQLEQDAGGYFPRITARAVLMVAGTLKRRVQAQEDAAKAPAETAPADEAPASPPEPQTEYALEAADGSSDS